MKKVYRNAGEGVRRLVSGEYCHPEWQQLAVQAHHLSLQQQIDDLVAVSALDRQQIQILPHQVNAVMTAINKLHTRAILADEVGLGKTIEAGLVIKEYLARGLVKRVLILCPAPLTESQTDEIRSIGARAFEAIGGAGLARVDCFLTDDGFVVNEVNTMPGFTPLSMYPRCWAATGVSYGELVTELIELGRTAVR